jgi:predicted metal-dependent TIM-barrel fold hydrolase
MKLFDPHIHMTSRTTDDYQAMAQAGIVAVVEPAFWLGQPRTHVGSFEDYFLSLLGWERFRARQFGIQHFCTLGMNPKEANHEELAAGVLELLPRYLSKEGVVAVGEIGFDDVTPAEDRIFRQQVELAKEFDLPILIHTPHRDKKRGTEYTIAVVKEMGVDPTMVLIDHNNEETIRATLDSGCWAGHSIYPDTKMDEARMVGIVQQFGSERVIINSAADWGVSDPLKVPKTARAMLQAGISEEAVTRIVWNNPVAFFAQSGRLTGIDGAVAFDQRELFEGNSVLRGQAPKVS